MEHHHALLRRFLPTPRPLRPRFDTKLSHIAHDARDHVLFSPLDAQADIPALLAAIDDDRRSTRNSPRQPPSCTRVTLRYRHPSLFPFPCNVPPATPLPTSCNSPMRHVHPTYVQGHHQHATDLTKSRLAHYATAPLTLPPPRRQPPSICRRPARRCHTSPACRRPTCCRRTYRRQARHHRLCLPAVAVPAAAQLAVIVYSRTSRRPTCRRRCVPA